MIDLEHHACCGRIGDSPPAGAPNLSGWDVHPSMNPATLNEGNLQYFDRMQIKNKSCCMLTGTIAPPPGLPSALNLCMQSRFWFVVRRWSCPESVANHCGSSSQRPMSTAKGVVIVHVKFGYVGVCRYRSRHRSKGDNVRGSCRRLAVLTMVI